MNPYEQTKLEKAGDILALIVILHPFAIIAYTALTN